CWLLSRELLYTALTRHQNQLVVLHQGPFAELRKFASEMHSETARRLTNVFAKPAPVRVKETFLEDGLIHRTRRNDLVRSKSEVIIADLLYSIEKLRDKYQYEQELSAADGTRRYPDFTIKDDELGLTVYWQHLGMLDD